MAIKLNTSTGSPFLEVLLAPGAANGVIFDLTPIRYEFLARVAGGALPASFSNECLEDRLAFKARLVRRDAVAEDDEVGGEDSAITLNFIDVAPGGRGMTRPVTVRAPT